MSLGPLTGKTNFAIQEVLEKQQLSKAETMKSKIRKEGGSATQKLKVQSEYAKLKQAGALKYLPKLSIDVPMSAQRIKFIDSYNENDGRWVYRIVTREEYQRKDQIKSLDSKTLKVIYDSTDRSPYYTDSNVPYIDERKLIPAKESETAIQQQRFKNRGYRRPLVSTGIQKKDRIYTDLNPYYRLSGDDDTTLVFESRFESGNLKRALHVEENEYDLIMQSDYNSPGYSQWYYFKATNTRANVKYTFNISSFYKPESLYNNGLKPLMYSTK